MGNQLAGIVPQQIHPVEYYLSDLANTELLAFDANLGSTRFLKVARVKLHQARPALAGGNGNYNGFGPPALAVAKVFVIHDPSLPIKLYRDRLDNLQRQLQGNPNALPCSKLVLNEKAGIMLRQYVKYNLYDRLSTRPFLTFFEKKWITFQLLKCCQWLHRQGICHGDLKLENILITSNLWVLISDFAPFKPTTLPDDNPGDFTYFFDTTRRRTCNLAPERFLSDCDENIDPNQAQVTPPMDLFSLGCVIAELFTDVANFELFDLSSLLAYRKKDEKTLAEIQNKLETISDKNIRNLVKNLIELDYSERMSTTQHLRELTATVFPKYFEMLYEYLKELVHCAPDEKITRLKADIETFVKPIVDEDPNGLLLLLVMITSSLRSLKHVHAKITALRLVVQLTKYDPLVSNFILDRVLPYLLSMLNDKNVNVRREAVDSLTITLGLVTSVPASDNNVFHDYVLPILHKLVSDPSPVVRMNFAANMGELATIAQRFLDISTETDSTERSRELDALRSSFQNMISYLLTDSDTGVRIMLLSTDIKKLCEFFGTQRTNDVILSHIITFLNNKQDFELRACFFDHIFTIAAFLGQSCSKILKPLLQQGLSDSEETIIAKTLNALSKMTTADCITRTTIYELIAESMPLMSHPNLWIRHALVGFIMSLTRQLSLAEVNCKIIPLIRTYLKRDLHLLTEELILDSMVEPIERELYNMIVFKTSTKQIDLLLECLKEKKLLRSLPKHHSTPNYLQNQSQLYGKVISSANQSGIVPEQLEDQILNLADIIKRIAKNASKGNQLKKDGAENSGLIKLTSKSRKGRAISLNDDEKNAKLRNMYSLNEDWQMSQRQVASSIATLVDASDDNGIVPIAKEAIEQPHNNCPPCTKEFNVLVNHRKDIFEMSLWSRGTYASPRRRNGYLAHAQGRPRGILIGHIHEHKKSINKLVAINKVLFATCSNDGTIKTWDAGTIEMPRSSIIRAKQTVSLNCVPVEGMAYMSALDTLLAYTSNGVVHGYRVDSNSFKLTHLQETNMTKEDRLIGITDLITTTPFSFMVSFSDSNLVAYDLRQAISVPTLKLNIDQRDGFVTALEGNEYCVFAATSSGCVYIFDNRFGMQANILKYPDRKRIRRLLYTPQGLYVSVKGNNEVTLFDCESGSRLKTLWTSRAPVFTPLTQKNPDITPDTVLSMVSMNTASTNALVTAGTDMRMRYWDLKNAAGSCMVSDGLRHHSYQNCLQLPVNKNLSCAEHFDYSSKFVDGVECFLEDEKQRTNGESSSSSIEQQGVPTGHKDCISDLIYMEHYNFLISGSKDGVIKLWK